MILTLQNCTSQMTHVELKEKEKVSERSAKDKAAHTGMYSSVSTNQSTLECNLSIVYIPLGEKCSVINKGVLFLAVLSLGPD